MKFLAVCFDCDGTLYPPSLMRRDLLLCALGRPIFSLRYFMMRRAFRRLQKGRIFRPSLSFAEREALLMAGRGDLLLSDGGERPPADGPALDLWRGRLADFYAAMARKVENLRPREGVARTLRRLREEGVTVGVASDFPIGRKLETLGLEDLVDFKIDPARSGYLKPDKRCFDYLADCARINDADRARLLYVGDSFRKDYMGAAGAGMSAALLGRGGGRFFFPSWADFDSWLFDEDTEV